MILNNRIYWSSQLPAYSASVSDVPLHWGDALLASLFLITLGIEFTADNQQWAFHNFKRDGVVSHEDEWVGARLEFTEEDTKRGFLTRGLWYVNCTVHLFI